MQMTSLPVLHWAWMDRNFKEGTFVSTMLLKGLLVAEEALVEEETLEEDINNLNASCLHRHGYIQSAAMSIVSAA
ncbi:unnamed protein product [Rhodiola kirilowii]